MSEATTQRLKVSREGMILIKSFEGFRPHAVRDQNGGWVIGYGHTLSAREGLTVGEADAELLLQYDLLPVVKMLNDRAAGLNQHQFDALASFAFSIGIDRFLTSDVAGRVASGALGEAADALIGWPEPTPPEASLRRRAAERALFVADPANAVTLADLLAAPLPPPEIVAVPIAPAPAIAARAAAVASLLGEPAEPAPEPVVPTFAAEPEPAPEPALAEPTSLVEAGPASPPDPDPEPVVQAPAHIAASFNFQRFSPYAAAILGPLPGLGQAGAPATNLSLQVATPVTPTAGPEPVEAEAEAAPAPEDREPERGLELEPEHGPVPEAANLAPPELEPEPEPEPALAPEPAPPPATDPFPPLAEPAPGFPLPTPAVDAEPPALILTPFSDDAAVQRPVWGEQQRDAPAADQDALFEEEPSELSVLRHEEVAEPRRFDTAQAAFLIMGATGLVSCAASAAAFRKAIEETSPLDDFTVIAWTLAVIGAVCVVTSAVNLYPRIFPPKDR